MTTPKSKKSKLGVVIGIVLILGVICGAFAYVYHVVSQYDLVFAQHLYVNDIPIGGLTPEQASKQINEQLDTYNENHFITLQNDKTLVRIAYKQFNPQNNVKQLLDQAFKIGHEGSLWERFLSSKQKEIEEKHFKVDQQYTKAAIQAELQNYAQQFAVDAVPATINRKNGQFITTPHEDGYQLNLSATTDLIYDYLHAPIITEAPIQVVLETISAPVKEEELKNNVGLLASFSTSYNNSDQLRNENLKLAASKINKKLEPEEVFSLSTQLEPITAAAGYKDAKVIINGKLEDGIGGGVCQIASTLYNALLLTHVEIVTRANHSLPVAYVPLGRDATYSTDIIDFKFKNNGKYPLFIESYCENNNVIVNVYGEKTLKPAYDEIKFTSETIKVTPPPEPKYEKDSTLYEGQTKQEVNPLEGKTVKLYRMFYKNGELVHKELVNTSYYKARPAIIKVGTKPLLEE